MVIIFAFTNGADNSFAELTKGVLVIELGSCSRRRAASALIAIVTHTGLI